MTRVKPTLTNDIVNAVNFTKKISEKEEKKVHITLSMTFADLAKPETILPQIELLEKEFPNTFRWMGEINVVKQALFSNGHYAVPKEKIKEWATLMEILEQRDIPLSFHLDLETMITQQNTFHLWRRFLIPILTTLLFGIIWGFLRN